MAVRIKSLAVACDMVLRGTTSNLMTMACRLEGDIRLRGLRPGDRYLTTADAAAMLNVSPATAHRAINLLVARQLVVRHHGRGTFVAQGIGDSPAPVVRTIVMLSSDDDDSLADPHLDAAFVHALRGRFPAASVQFGCVPRSGGLQYVRVLVEPRHRCGQLMGVVLRGCGQDVYRYVSGQGVPAVVIGSPYADHAGLSSVDLDHTQAGYLLAQHLVQKRHRRLALLMLGESRPANDAFYGGVSRLLSEAGLPHNAMTVRFASDELGAFRAQVSDLLEAKARPTGVICGAPHLVGIVAEVAKEMGISVPVELELVYHAKTTAPQLTAFAHTEPRCAPSEIAELVVRLLREQSNGDFTQQRTVVEVRLRTAAGGQSARRVRRRDWSAGPRSGERLATWDIDTEDCHAGQSPSPIS